MYSFKSLQNMENRIHPNGKIQGHTSDFKYGQSISGQYGLHMNGPLRKLGNLDPIDPAQLSKHS